MVTTRKIERQHRSPCTRFQQGGRIAYSLVMLPDMGIPTFEIDAVSCLLSPPER